MTVPSGPVREALSLESASLSLGMRHLSLLAILLLWPTSGLAQQDDEAIPESVKGLKIVIPEARGRRGFGQRKLSRSLRRTMTAGVGPLIKSRSFRRAQRKLRIRGRRRFAPKNLARAGKRVGAQYVLDVEITKKGWLYTARALLINTETAEIQMDFRSQFYRPQTDTPDRGRRIGRRTLKKLATLLERGEVPGVDAAPPPPVATAPPPPEPPSPTRTAPPPPPPPPIAVAPPPPVESRPPPPPVEASPPPTRARTPVTSNTRAEVEVGARPKPSKEIFRAGLGGGAGLLRTYSLSSGSVDTSALSHQLAPLSLVTAEVEVAIPGVGIAFMAGGSFRPVRYDLGIGEDGENAPRGSLIDARVALGYQIDVAGQGLETFEITPRVGGRFGFSSVEDHPGNVVLSANTVSIGGGVGARMPVNEVLEIDAGIDAGYMVVYSERPASSGDSSGGFSLGGDLGARIWLTSAIAIAFDNRFVYESVSFTGPPTRQLPAGEQTQLADATVSIKDLRTSIGLAFRL